MYISKRKEKHLKSIGKFSVSKGGSTMGLSLYIQVSKMTAICKNRILNMVNDRPVAPLTRSPMHRPSSSRSIICL